MGTVVSVALSTGLGVDKSVGSSEVVFVEVMTVMLGYSDIAVSLIGVLTMVPAEGAAVPVPGIRVGVMYVELGNSAISVNKIGVLLIVPADGAAVSVPRIAVGET